MSVVEFDDTEDEYILLLDPKNPLASAEKFIEQWHTVSGVQTLYRHRGAYYEWTGTYYRSLDDDDLRSAVYRFLKAAFVPSDKLLPEPFKPTRHKVTDVVDALKASANLISSVAAPAWLKPTPDMDQPPNEILACANGLLHLPTLELIPPTPLFYGHNAREYDFDPQAPAPTRWLKFLNEDLWSGDAESVETLGEIFGYLLTANTQQQKILMLVGPKRSGKGTIGRVLTAMLGRENVCAPTLGSLGSNFGLQPLIGKQVAIVSDARLGSRSDQSVIAERLLSISGEDSLTIDRKYLSAWTGRLGVRFLILTNELPRFSDASGALPSRFIILTLQQSFLGREDQGLTDKLLHELPGILNWAIEGWERLQGRGHFLQPRSAADAIAELHDLSSPVGAFVRDRCAQGPGRSVERAVLFDRWKEWCGGQGRDRPGTAASFGRDLRAVVPGLKTSQPRTGTGQRLRYYEGIGLADG